MLRTNLNLPFHNTIPACFSLQTQPRISFKGEQGNYSTDSLDFENPKFRQTSKSIWKAIKAADNIVIAAQRWIDADGLCTGLALREAIVDRYPRKKVVFFVPSGIPPYLSNTPGVQNISTGCPFFKTLDLAICVDCTPDNVCGKEIFTKAKHSIVIDHHPYPEPPSSNRLYLIDPKAPSTTSILYSELIKPFDIGVSEQMAECIATGIITDTRNLNSASRDSSAYRIINELRAQFGERCSLAAIHKKLNQNNDLKPEVVELEKALRRRDMIQSFPTNQGLSVNYISISKEDLKKRGISSKDQDLMSMLKRLLQYVSHNADIGMIIQEQDDSAKVHVKLLSNRVGLSGFLQAHFGGGHDAIGAFNVPGSIKYVSDIVKQDLKNYKFAKLAK